MVILPYIGTMGKLKISVFTFSFAFNMFSTLMLVEVKLSEILK